MRIGAAPSCKLMIIGTAPGRCKSVKAWRASRTDLLQGGFTGIYQRARMKARRSSVVNVDHYPCGVVQALTCARDHSEGKIDEQSDFSSFHCLQLKRIKRIKRIVPYPKSIVGTRNAGRFDDRCIAVGAASQQSNKACEVDRPSCT
jgi:hypothetical protein